MKKELLKYLNELLEKYPNVGMRDIAKRSVIKEIIKHIEDIGKKKAKNEK